MLKLALGVGHLPDPCLFFSLPSCVLFVGWFPCWLKVNCPMLPLWSLLKPCPVYWYGAGLVSSCRWPISWLLFGMTDFINSQNSSSDLKPTHGLVVLQEFSVRVEFDLLTLFSLDLGGLFLQVSMTSVLCQVWPLVLLSCGSLVLVSLVLRSCRLIPSFPLDCRAWISLV